MLCCGALAPAVAGARSAAAPSTHASALGARAGGSHARARLAGVRGRQRGCSRAAQCSRCASCQRAARTPRGRLRLPPRSARARWAALLAPALTRALPRRRRVGLAFPLCSLVESSRGANPALEAAIQGALGSCVTETDLGLPGKRVVRGGWRARTAARN